MNLTWQSFFKRFWDEGRPPESIENELEKVGVCIMIINYPVSGWLKAVWETG